ncbi:MAG: hypothetical protein ACR2K2_09145 [Mycobacteriales bacterium]
MDDSEFGAAGVVRHGDDLQLDPAIVRREVQQLIADENVSYTHIQQ